MRAHHGRPQRLPHGRRRRLSRIRRRTCPTCGERCRIRRAWRCYFCALDEAGR